MGILLQEAIVVILLLSGLPLLACSATGLIVSLDFRCNNATFVLGKDRVRAFFDHRREDLVLLVNHYFPKETSLSSATVVKKEFLH